jgi:ApbE superfamily uncharacterized protein (UPF0280 family)
MSAVAALLPDGRLHLQHGPIDCLCRAWGEAAEVRAAYEQAARFFVGVLDGLCAELPLLRSPLPASVPQGAPKGAIARAMHAACAPFADRFITPMAAVAGAVADAVLAAMVRDRDVTRAFVNNGGDIAFHLAPGRSLRCGLVADLASVVWPSDAGVMADPVSRVMAGASLCAMADPVSRVTAGPLFCVMAGPSGRSYGPPKGMLGPATHDSSDRSAGKSWVTGPRPVMTRGAGSADLAITRAHGRVVAHDRDSTVPPLLDGTFLLAADHPARGLATSGRACKGRGGRSFSFGIADSVSVLARTAAQADAAATIIGNAVDLPGNPAIDRRPASEIDPDSDLGDRLVTFDVAPLTAAAIEAALDAGETMADRLLRDGLIEGAVLALRGRLRVRHAAVAPPTLGPRQNVPPSLAPLEPA